MSGSMEYEELWGEPKKGPTEKDLAEQEAYNKFLEDEVTVQALRDAGVYLP